jgi:hypothetical protein
MHGISRAEANVGDARTQADHFTGGVATENKWWFNL